MKGTTEIHNGMDIIDSRDVIARIEELESIFADAEISEDNGATPQLDDEGKTKEEIATCGECGRDWNDALISGSTPAPSGRCPYESIHEELEELKLLKAFEEEGRGASDWQHGEAFIRESYFETYAQELAEDIGALENCDKWLATCIDWEKAADELKMDYSSAEFGDVTYYYRS